MNMRQKSEKPGAKKVRGDERLPAELSRVSLNAAGIDVGASSHFVAVPEDRWDQPVREFEAFTADLYRLADWLAGRVPGGDRGDGVHRGLLDTPVWGAGGAGV